MSCKTDKILTVNKNKTKVAYYITYMGDDNIESDFIFPFENWNSTSPVDTLSIIHDLLLFENDTRLSNKPITYAKSPISKRYLGESKRYSLQVEALFIINYFFFEGHINSFVPVLINTNTGEEASVDGVIVQEAYLEYKKWFLKVKKMGLHKARKDNLYPLENSYISWY